MRVHCWMYIGLLHWLQANWVDCNSRVCVISSVSMNWTTSAFQFNSSFIRFLLSSVFLIASLYFFICMFCCLFHLFVPLLHPVLLTLLHVRLFRVFSTNTQNSIYLAHEETDAHSAIVNSILGPICKIVHSTTATLMKDQCQTDRLGHAYSHLMIPFNARCFPEYTYRLPRHAARLAELARS